MALQWTFSPTAAPAFTAAFLASAVEFIEAFTIVLAVATARGWRPAVVGGVVGVATLGVLAALLGRTFPIIPIHVLQSVVGTLLLLFGLRWLRKAILRGAGLLSLHDEDRIFAVETETLRRRPAREFFDSIGTLAAFKAVLLEGTEILFVVLAVGAAEGSIGLAAMGAVVAGVAVLAVGIIVHAPLARVPANALKFIVGVLLASFGVFWTGEGLGIPWPGDRWTLLAFLAAFGIAGLGGIYTAQLNRKALL